MNKNTTTTATPRAIKVDRMTLEVIAKQGMNLDLPPDINELLDTITYPDEYYFVTGCPGFSADKPISWVLMPDFMFDKRFTFGTKPSDVQLISLIVKDPS